MITTSPKHLWLRGPLLACLLLCACDDSNPGGDPQSGHNQAEDTGGDLGDDAQEAQGDDAQMDLGDDAQGDDAQGDDAQGDDAQMDLGDDGDQLGDFCGDPAQGSGALAAPQPSAGEFTTALLDCTVSAQEVALCAGAQPQFSQEAANGMRVLSGNAIPNHDTATFPNAGNPNRISPQQVRFAVTLTPQRTDTATAVRLSGVALNGVKMEPETAEVYADTAWRYEALTFQGRAQGDTVNMPGSSLGFDCNFAHVQPNGYYHYHGVPTGLMPTSAQITHVGWAADGFPILGRYGHQDAGDPDSPLVELRGSYRVKQGARQPLSPGEATTPPGDHDGTFVQDWEYAPGSGDLDQCNGRQEEVQIQGVTYPYAYYLTYTYPFMPRCVWGEPAQGFGYADGPGDGEPGPGGDNPPEEDGLGQPCQSDAECACPDLSQGCACAQTPNGQQCIPACQSDADCPPVDPVGNPVRCDTQQGLCRPAM